MFVLYVVGVPLLAFIILFKNRMKLNKPEVLRYILLLYQGLKHERYYWELCNTARKCILLALHVFIPDDLKILKALFGVFTLFIFSTMQARINPFKISVISRLGKLTYLKYIENREMLSSLLTLYGGLIFVQNTKSLVFINIIFFIVILIFNIRFIVLWAF